MKKILKFLLISVLCITAVFMVVILGFRYWLKNNLPQYIQEETPYNVTYKDLKISFLHGDITASHVKISSKNTDNHSVVGLDGTVDTIYISNLGIYDALINKTVNSNEIRLNQPNLKITLIKADEKKIRKKKSPIVFENVEIRDGNIEIERNNHSPFLKIKKLSLSIENLDFRREDEDRKLPFVFDNYSIKGKDLELHLDDVYRVFAKNIDTQNRIISVKDFSLTPQMKWSDFNKKYPFRNLFYCEISEIKFKDIVLKNKRINFEKVFFSEPNITLYSSESKTDTRKKKIAYAVDLQNFSFVDGGFHLINSKGEVKLTAKKINASVDGFLMDEKMINGKIPFSYKNYKIRSGAIVFNANKFYKLTLNQLVADKNSWNVERFSMNPLLSKHDFSRKIPTEKDWYNIKVAKTKISGIDFKFINNQPNIYIRQIDFDGINANIYRSKIPKDDTTRKKMYSELLREIKFPFLVHNLNVTNSFLQYDEDNINDNPAGKLTFSSFNLKAKNINSNKGFKDAKVPIKINCQFMNISPMNVDWFFDTSKANDFFTISGNISDLPAPQINSFLKPYLNIAVDGYVKRLNFDFKGDSNHIFGEMNLRHQNLKVNILDEETKAKKRFLSALVNLLVKDNSNRFPEMVNIYAKRDVSKSFFNLFWRGVEDGLTKVLISKRIEEKNKGSRKK